MTKSIFQTDDVLISEGGLDEEGRVALIQLYQQFLNRFPAHAHTSLARSRISELEQLPPIPNVLLMYSLRYEIQEQAYRNYVRQWISTGALREFGIEVIPNPKVWPDAQKRLGVEPAVEKRILEALQRGALVVVSAAALKSPMWNEDRVLIFEPKAGR